MFKSDKKQERGLAPQLARRDSGDQHEIMGLYQQYMLTGIGWVIFFFTSISLDKHPCLSEDARMLGLETAEAW